MRRRMMASSPLPASPMSKPRIPRVERRLRRSAVSSSTMRTVPCVASISGFRFYLWQCEEEGRVRLGSAVHPNAPSMRLCDSSGHRKTNAGPSCFVLRFRRTIKTFKDTHSLSRGDVRSLILHAEDNLRVRRIYAECDSRSGTRILRGIIDDLYQGHLQQAPISPDMTSHALR